MPVMRKKCMKKAHAHCDVPCGVYETDSALWAVETCQKLVEKLLALETRVRRSGNDLTIIATSFLVPEALRAVEELSSQGLEIEVIDVASVAPLEREFYPNAEKIKKPFFHCYELFFSFSQGN